MNLSLLSRYAFFACIALFTLLSLPFLGSTEWLWPFTLLGVALSLLGLFDLIQTPHAVRRNYPILGNIRYLVEGIRPEIRQYLLEADGDALPFSRAQRSLVYSRAKNESSEKPFGTLIDVYTAGYEFISHSMRPAPLSDPCEFRVDIGGPQCSKPYSASLFNVSAMSFGALSANAIRSLNRGAQMGNFYHDTGEGSISPYHRENGGDLVWELGSGYFGCRTRDGKFDPERFAAQALDPQVKMIEIKLSQGAKPGHGGILPKHKVTPEIAATRGVPMGEDCVSPSRHSAFSTPIELMQFIAQLRELSGGKPVGFKFCLGHPWEFMGIAKAMLETGILPDFIVVERLRYRQRPGHRRGLGQLGARLHVRHRLHPVAELPYQQVPDRRRHPGPAAPARAGGAGQGRAGAQLPSQHPQGPGRDARRGGPGTSLAARSQAPGATHHRHRDPPVLAAALLPQAGRTAFQQDRGRVLRAHVEHGAGRQLRRGGLSRRPRTQEKAGGIAASGFFMSA